MIPIMYTKGTNLYILLQSMNDGLTPPNKLFRSCSHSKSKEQCFRILETLPKCQMDMRVNKTAEYIQVLVNYMDKLGMGGLDKSLIEKQSRTMMGSCQARVLPYLGFSGRFKSKLLKPLQHSSK